VTNPTANKKPKNSLPNLDNLAVISRISENSPKKS
jgi:hypothetical protein